MEEFYITKNDIKEELEVKYNKKISDATLNNLINKNNFYRRKLGIKKLNGWENNEGQGKIWYFNEEGKNELIQHALTIRERKTKEEINQLRLIEESKNRTIQICFELRADIKEQLDSFLKTSGKSLKEYLTNLISTDIENKNEIINEIQKLQKLL